MDFTGGKIQLSAMRMNAVKSAAVGILLIVMLVLFTSLLLLEAPTKAVQPMNWNRILHFIPEKSRNQPFHPKKYKHSCLSLFMTNSSRHINITQEMKEMREIISKELKGDKHHLTPEHPKLTLTYQELARQEFVHTVCEIGFNVGQSAISWLTTKPDLELYSFDIGTRPYTKHMGAVLQKKYPDRFNLMIGNSKHTVLKWAVKHGKKCDILSIDGDHQYSTVFQDLLNMKLLAAKRNIIIADDIVAPGVKKAWQTLVDVGYIHHLYDCRIRGMDVDYVIGYYPNLQSMQI